MKLVHRQTYNKHPGRRTVDTWIFVIGLVLVAAGLVTTANLLHTDSHAQPKVSINKSDWHVSFDVAECDLQREASAQCPANPASALYKSDINRDSPKFLERFASNRGDSFWLGLTVDAKSLQQASKLNAFTLKLPRVNGITQIWIDGVYNKTHDFSLEKLPLTLTIPKARLTDGKDLHVAMGVFPYPHQPTPVAATMSEEGFYTAMDADRLATSEVFEATGPHLIFVALFLVVAGLLGSAARSGRTRDFSIGAQLALVVALASLLSTDLSFRVLNVPSFERASFLLLLIEALLILRLTLTIAHNARETSVYEGLALGAGLSLIALIAPGNWIEVSGVNWMTSFGLPLVYLTCSFVTGRNLQQLAKTKASRVRLEFLMLATAGLAITGAAYVIESWHQSGFHVLWARAFNLVLLFALLRTLAKANQTKSSLIELSPVSKFHRQDPMPEKVEGWIVRVDLATPVQNDRLTATILSQLWTIARLNNAEIVRAENGKLTLIFEDDYKACLDEMARCLKDLEQRLPILFSNTENKLAFKAAVVRGEAKPGWRAGATGVSKIPEWTGEAFAKCEELLKREGSVIVEDGKRPA